MWAILSGICEARLFASDISSARLNNSGLSRILDLLSIRMRSFNFPCVGR